MSENQNEQPKRKRGQRGKGKKTLAMMQAPTQSQQPQSPNESESNSDPSSDLEVTIESHNSQPEDERGFGATLRRAAQSSGLFDDTPAPSKTKKSKANQEEFNSLVIAVLTLSVSFANMRPEIKPNESELSVFSNHLTGILVRHLPISKGLSADALDVIGLFAVISGYYARVSPELRRPAKKAEVAQTYPTPTPVAVDPISDLSPEAGEFLRAAQLKVAQ